MDELDEILLQAIRNIGCEFDEVKSLSDFQSEHVIEAVVRCLWQIDPSLKTSISSCRLPPNMTSRFRVATAITGAIQDLGYRAEIGYQTLLYGSESDLRNIFVFLTEKLPKVSVTTPSIEASALERAKLNTAGIISRELSAPWIPWFCRRLQYQWDGRLWHPPENTPSSVSFHSHNPWNITNVPWCDLPATAIETCPSSFEVKVSESPSRSVGAQHIEAHLHQRRTPRVRPPLAQKPKLAPKPAAKPTQTKRELQAAIEEAPLIATPEVDPRFELLQSQLAEIDEEIREVETRLTASQQQGRKTRRERENIEKTLDSKKLQLTSSGNRYATLLQNPQESLEKLEKFAEQSEIRLSNLETQWVEHRLPKENELSILRKRLAMQGDSSESLLSEIKAMRTKTTELNEELLAKQSYLGILQKEYENMSKGSSRASYTRRILEIVASVRKQREEIERVLKDNLVVQKDINMLSGNLERTFSAVEEKLYRDATNDPLLQRAYRLLVNMHENCAKIVNVIEDTGHVIREIEVLQDQIETESQKATDSNLERLVNDYCTVHQQNEVLAHSLETLTNK